MTEGPEKYPYILKFEPGWPFDDLPSMVKYYADRASTPGTLIISEASAVSHLEEGQDNTPGFVSDREVAAWKNIIDAVLQSVRIP